jgi:hypothetical protein
LGCFSYRVDEGVRNLPPMDDLHVRYGCGWIALEQHGFTAIHRCTFGDARPVEDKGRFDGCLALECRK